MSRETRTCQSNEIHRNWALECKRRRTGRIRRLIPLAAGVSPTCCMGGGGGAFESEANLNRRRPGTGRRAWPPRRVGNRRGRPLAGQTPGDESPVGADLQGRSVGERQYGWSVGGQAGRSARLHGRPWRHPEDARRGAGARLLFVLGQRNTPPQAGNTPPFAMCFAGQLQLQPFNTA